MTSRSIVVLPDKVNLTFETSPPGLTVYVDGIAHTTPFVYDTLIGFTHTIEARAPGRYAFDTWSDGGGPLHDITVPTSSLTYTATFNDTSPGSRRERSPNGGSTKAPGTRLPTRRPTATAGRSSAVRPGLRAAWAAPCSSMARTTTSTPPSSRRLISRPVLRLLLDEAERLCESVGGDGDQGRLRLGCRPKLHWAHGRFTTFNASGTAHDLTGTTIVDDNQWHHVVAVYTGTQKLLYIDGVLNASVELLANAPHQQLQPSTGDEPGVWACLLRRGTGRRAHLRTGAHGGRSDVVVQPVAAQAGRDSVVVSRPVRQDYQGR